MSSMRLPTGIFVAQAKKYAKRLAKSSGTNLSSAQNQIARNHCRADWAVMMHMLDTQSQLNAVFKQNFFSKEVITFPAHKSLTLMLGETGAGKTLLLLEVIAQWLKQSIPVLLIDSVGIPPKVPDGLPDDFGLDARAVRHLKEIYPSLLQIYSGIDVDFDSLQLNGAVLVIDELATLLQFGGVSKIQQLINTSMHTVIAGQSVQEALLLASDLKNIRDENLHFLILETNIQDVMALSELMPWVDLRIELSSLTSKRNEFTEFLSVTVGQVSKLRFKLHDHSALND